MEGTMGKNSAAKLYESWGERGDGGTQKILKKQYSVRELLRKRRRKN